MAHYKGYIISNDDSTDGNKVGTLNAPIIIPTFVRGVVIFRDRDFNYLTLKARYENNG